MNTQNSNMNDEKQDDASIEDVRRLLDLGHLLKSVLNDYEINELRELLKKEESQE